MIKDSDTVSGWFVLNCGKVYGRCPGCHSPRLSYFKSRKPGLKGICSTSKGIAPACMDCGKSLPIVKSHLSKHINLTVNQSDLFY